MELSYRSTELENRYSGADNIKNEEEVNLEVPDVVFLL